MLVSRRRDIARCSSFFAAAVVAHSEPDEVVTDRAAALAHVVADLLPDARHHTGQYANNRIECDHGRLKARLRRMRGYAQCGASRPTAPPASVIGGHAFIPNLRRGRHELGAEARHEGFRIFAVFDELTSTI